MKRDHEPTTVVVAVAVVEEADRVEAATAASAAAADTDGSNSSKRTVPLTGPSVFIFGMTHIGVRLTNISRITQT